MSTGSRPTPTCNFISRRQAHPGSIRSRSGSRSCRGSHLAAPPSQASSSFRNTSMPTSTRTTTKPSPSSGPRKRSGNAVSKAAVSLSSDSGYYASDGVLVAPSGSIVRGRQALTTYYASRFASGARGHAFKVVEAHFQGNGGDIRFPFSYTSPGAPCTLFLDAVSIVLVSRDHAYGCLLLPV